eukprot:5789192-Amphidinium_carterae.1
MDELAIGRSDGEYKPTLELIQTVRTIPEAVILLVFSRTKDTHKHKIPVRTLFVATGRHLALMKLGTRTLMENGRNGINNCSMCRVKSASLSVDFV